MSEVETYGLSHLAVAVANVERTRQFYQAVFGMVVMYQQPGFLQLTTPGSNDILVFEEKESKNIGESAGIAHFGFRLKDPELIKDVTRKIINAGAIITSHGEFVPGSPYIFFKDPDGYEIEVWYELIS